jgi:cyclic pyranopterin phosphate synthase
MRDVTRKVNTLRSATAVATLRACADTVSRIRDGNLPKGDARTVAKVAGIQAAKGTSALIPYCHPIPIEFADIRFELSETTVEITATVKAIYKTGVEMEALTAASVAALTLYDMTKMVDDDVTIEKIRLLEKRGGNSDFPATDFDIGAAIITVSDSASSGEREDISGSIAAGVLTEFGAISRESTIVSDDPKEIETAVRQFLKSPKFSLIVVTGGTGAGPRDNTPEAVRKLFDKELPGVAEQMRRYGQDRTPFAMLSRSVCGIAGDSVILCLPGSPKAVEEGLRAVLPHLLHVIPVLRGAGHDDPATAEDAP